MTANAGTTGIVSVSQRWEIHGINLGAGLAPTLAAVVALVISPGPGARAVYGPMALVVAARTLWWSTSHIALDRSCLHLSAVGHTRCVDLQRLATVVVQAAGPVSVHLTDRHARSVTVRLGLLWDHEQGLARTLQQAARRADHVVGLDLLDRWTR